MISRGACPKSAQGVRGTGCFWTLEHGPDGSFIDITLEKQTMGDQSWKLLLESDSRAVADVAATDYAFFELSKDGEPLGKVVLGLFGDVVPKTVASFKALCTGEKVRRHCGHLCAGLRAGDVAGGLQIGCVLLVTGRRLASAHRRLSY